MNCKSGIADENETMERERKSRHISRQRMRIPLKLLGKKFNQTTRLVASSKVLHNAIPTKNCDIIMMLPARTDDSTLMWLLARLRSRTPNLHVHVRHLKNTGVYAFYLTATYENLLKGAEDLGIRKPVRQEFGGGVKEFVYEEQDCYEGIDSERNFLSSQERQSIVYHMLVNLRALEGEALGNIKFLDGQAIVPLLQSKNIVTQVFPLHDSTSLTELRKDWVQAFFHRQPLGAVCNYFGVKIALYFAYLGHYTLALCVPTLLGIVVWFLQQESQEMADLCFVLFALFNVFWATIYLVYWKRKNAELAYRWGTLDKKDALLEDPRPLYTGYLVTSPVTGRLEPFYPNWKRNLFRYCISFPVVSLCLAVVFNVMLLIFQLQEWVNDLVQSEDIPAFCRFLPKILLAVVIGILDDIYKKIAVWLNDRENYRLEESYENHLIVKLVLFQFVNSFLSLFYIAFYLQDMDRLRDQLAALLITRQVIGNIREALVPYLFWKVKLFKVGYDITGHMSPNTLEKEIKSMTGVEDNTDVGADEQHEGQTEHHHSNHQSSALVLTQAELESTMKKYEGTFEDYLEMFIQYGYVILFSSAFPLAALCALLNNVIEIRSDAFKLCINHQRPFGKRVKNIGTWLDALEVMGVIAVVVNCALIGVSGQVRRMQPDLNTTSVIFLIVVLEHVILVLKTCIAYAIPDVPQWIARELARWEFTRREALKSVESSHSVSPWDRPFGFSRGSPSPVQSPIQDVRPPPRTSKGISSNTFPVQQTGTSPTNSSEPHNSSFPTSTSSQSSSNYPSSFSSSSDTLVKRTVKSGSSPSGEYGDPFNVPLKGLRKIHFFEEPSSSKSSSKSDQLSGVDKTSQQNNSEPQQAFEPQKKENAASSTCRPVVLNQDDSSSVPPYRAAVGFSNPNAVDCPTPPTDSNTRPGTRSTTGTLRHRSSQV